MWDQFFFVMIIIVFFITIVVKPLKTMNQQAATYSGGSSYGRTGRPPPPTDQNLGLVIAARLRHGGKFKKKSLTFGHFLYKMYKRLSASGASLWTQLGAPPPDPHLGSRSARSPWSPPLAIPGSATGHMHVLYGSRTVRALDQFVPLLDDSYHVRKLTRNKRYTPDVTTHPYSDVDVSVGSN